KGSAVCRLLRPARGAVAWTAADRGWTALSEVGPPTRRLWKTFAIEGACREPLETGRKARARIRPNAIPCGGFSFFRRICVGPGSRPRLPETRPFPFHVRGGS